MESVTWKGKYNGFHQTKYNSWPNIKSWTRLFVLHIDPWLSRQSEILSTRCTSQNNRSQSHCWKEMYRCYEMIYADAYVAVWVLVLDLESHLQPEGIWSVTESACEWLGALSGPRVHSRPLVKYLLAVKQKKC